MKFNCFFPLGKNLSPISPPAPPDGGYSGFGALFGARSFPISFSRRLIRSRANSGMNSRVSLNGEKGLAHGKRGKGAEVIAHQQAGALGQFGYLVFVHVDQIALRFPVVHPFGAFHQGGSSHSHAPAFWRFFHPAAEGLGDGLVPEADACQGDGF